MNLTQIKLAELWGLSTKTPSQILNGEREPDVVFLKALRLNLMISGDFY